MMHFKGEYPRETQLLNIWRC